MMLASEIVADLLRSAVASADAANGYFGTPDVAAAMALIESLKAEDRTIEVRELTAAERKAAFTY